MEPSILGKPFSKPLLEEFLRVNIDIAGENGEYHTVVTDGPLFRRPLKIFHGAKVLRDGYWFSDVCVGGSSELSRTFANLTLIAYGRCAVDAALFSINLLA